MALISEAEDLQLKLQTKVAKILGAPIGLGQNNVSNLAISITQIYKTMFVHLKDKRLPYYVTDQILRMCGSPSLNYLSRVVPSNFMRKAAILFDGWARDRFVDRQKIDREILPDWISDQLCWGLEILSRERRN